MTANYFFAKLDNINAFNNLHRDAKLSAMTEHASDIYKFIIHDMVRTPCSDIPTTLFCHKKVQQGDTLNPLLFFLTIHPLIVTCRSPLRIIKS